MNQLNICQQFGSLALPHDLLDVIRQTTPRWSLSVCDILDPLHELFVALALIWYCEDMLLATNCSLEKFEVRVERLWSEELVNQRLQNLVVEIIVDLATEDRLRDQSSQRVPRNLIGIDVRSVFTHTINPLVNTVEGAPHVRLIEFVDF